MNWILCLLLPYAAYAASARDATRILYRCDLANDKHGIAAFTREGELIGAACDTRLGKSIDQAIAIDVVHAPPYLGNISIGEHSFDIHSNPSSASEPVCGRIYNDHELEIDCSIPMHSIDQPELAKALGGEHGSCFDDMSATEQLMEGSKILDTSFASMPPKSRNFTGTFDNDPTTNLSRRSGGCDTSQHSRLVDDGDPHQDLFHRQTNVSSSFKCSSTLASVTGGWLTPKRHHTTVEPTIVALRHPMAQQPHSDSLLMCIPSNGSAVASRLPRVLRTPKHTVVMDTPGRSFAYGTRRLIPRTPFRTMRVRLAKQAAPRLIRAIQSFSDRRTRMPKAATFTA